MRRNIFKTTYSGFTVISASIHLWLIQKHPTDLDVRLLKNFRTTIRTGNIIWGVLSKMNICKTSGSKKIKNFKVMAECQLCCPPEHGALYNCTDQVPIKLAMATKLVATKGLEQSHVLLLKNFILQKLLSHLTFFYKHTQ